MPRTNCQIVDQNGLFSVISLVSSMDTFNGKRLHVIVGSF